MNENCVGLGAYFSLAAHGRIVKDSQLAPDSHQQVELIRIANAGWDGYCFLESYAANKGADIHRLMAPVRGIVDQLEARLRPGDWLERVAKTHVAVGVIADFWCLVAETAGAQALVTPPVREAFGHTEWARQTIAQASADQTVPPRLSLWSRRVVGDVLATARAALRAYPDLDDAVTRAHPDLSELLTERHRQRMAAAGLKG